MLSTRRSGPALAFFAVAAVLAGAACDEPPAPPPVPPGDDDDVSDPPDPDVVVDCANANPDTTAVDLEQMATRFATDVFPLWTRAERLRGVPRVGQRSDTAFAGGQARPY